MKKIILGSLLLITSLFASYTTTQAKSHIGENIKGLVKAYKNIPEIYLENKSQLRFK